MLSISVVSTPGSALCCAPDGRATSLTLSCEWILAAPFVSFDHERNAEKLSSQLRTTGVLTMKWCRFQARDEVTFGIIEDDTVTAIEGSPFDHYTKTDTYPLRDR